MLTAISAASAQATRKELQRTDLTGTNMEIIVSVVEVAPGNGLPRHTHPGEEAVYFLEGATVQLLDGNDRSLETGTAVINVRDVPHAGFKVAGDKPLKMLTVHIVDKGKPVLVPAN